MVPLLLVLACQPSPTAGPDSGRGSGLDSGATAAPDAVDLTPLTLRWYGSDGGMDYEQLVAGLDWDLSWLGALPPADASHRVLADSQGDDVVLTLYPARLGLPDPSLPALTDALTEVRDWERQNGGIDPGRLLMLTLHEPWYYYAITGACADLDQWERRRGAADPDRYDVSVSQLASGGRRVWLPAEGAAVEMLGFLVGTSDAPLDAHWSPVEFETVDLMANGQQRFAAWSAEGELLPAADPDVVPAGQPGNCMWCHEDHLMTGSPDNPGGEDGLDYATWAARLDGWQAELQAWRSDLDTSVDYADHDAHAWGELVVREFLLPTIDRAAAEWGVNEADALAIIDAQGLSVQTDAEWPQRGPVLIRAEVDAVLAERLGRTPPAVLGDARELHTDAALRGEAWADWLDCEG